MSKEDWERGELTDDEGNLGRLVPYGRVIVPGKIELIDDALHWSLQGRFKQVQERLKTVEVSRSTLNEFVMLWRRRPQAIERFAQKWGVLFMYATKRTDPVHYRPCGEHMVRGADPIAAWQYYSRRAYAVLNIAAALRQDRLGDLDDWRAIADVDQMMGVSPSAFAQHRYGFGMFIFDKSANDKEAVERARECVASEIRHWLSFWRARRMEGLSDFAVVWDSKRVGWELRVDYHGFLFAAIALQLALCIVGAESLFTCSGCGVPYVREVKRPKPGTANYCSECSKAGVAQRRAVDAYRLKKAEAARLRSAGTPLREIALKLNAPISRVQKWCECGSEPASEPRARELLSRKQGGDRRRRRAIPRVRG